MRIVHLVPGTGNFHCGACLRDHALMRELASAGGVDVTMVPLYLPLVLDEDGEFDEAPVFLGGVNLFLQQKLGIFRRTPRWMDEVLDSGRLLAKVSEYSGMTQPRVLGEMTVSSFEGVDGRQRKEWARLIEWLLKQPKPDVVSLSNGLLAGIAKTIRRELGVPVVATLQGEDAFLDSLPDPYRERSWELFRGCGRDVERYVAVSSYYGELMQRRLEAPPGKIAVVPNGVDANAFAPAADRPAEAVIGFLGRMCHGKGLHLVVRAFLKLKEKGTIAGLRLKIGGAKTASDEKYVAELRCEIDAAGRADSVSWHPNLSFEEKREFLRSLTVFSLPAHYGEAFGLPVLEAMASGVPVVQPRHGAFPEVVEKAGGGILYDGEPENVEALASGLERILTDEALRTELGRQGREGVVRDFSLERMAGGFSEVLEKALSPSSGSSRVRHRS